MAHIENELKFRVEDSGLFAARLEALGLSSAGSRRERDYFYDFRDGSLRKEKITLRLRDLGSSGLMTIKGPCLKSRFKRRLEVNGALDDPGAARGLLRSCGLVERFGKEKIRTEYKYHGAVICVDRLPFIGEYVEIEGSPAAVTRAAADLGLDMNTGLKDTYDGLFKIYCLARKVSFRSMSFAQEKRLSRCLPRARRPATR